MQTPPDIDVDALIKKLEQEQEQKKKMRDSLRAQGRWGRKVVASRLSYHSPS